MTTFQAARTSQSRVFVAEGKPGPNNPPIFQGCLAMGGASQTVGDTTFILCPSPDGYDKFAKVGKIVGTEESVETSLTGWFPMNQLSNIIKWGRAKTPLAIHVHFGETSNPQNFNSHIKAVIFDDDAQITSTDIGEMGQLEESSSIEQSADISAADYYEVVPLNYIVRVADLIDTPAAGAAMARLYDTTLPLDNRFGFYVAAAGDGAAAAPELIYSIDGGATWSAMDLSAAIAAPNQLTGIAVVNEVPVMISEDTQNTYYADVLSGATAATEVVVGQALSCIAGVGSAAYVGGPSGYFGIIEDYTAGPTAMTLGTSADIVSVHALQGGIILAGTDDGYVFFSTDGVNFGSYEVEAGQIITAVCAVDADTFWAGSDTGNLYYSVDAGTTWASRGFPGSGSGTVTGIVFPELSVGWVAHDPGGATPGTLIKTVGAGAVGTWYQVPNGGGLPTIKSHKLASLIGAPNRLLLAGAVDAAGTDGQIILGLGT